MAWAACAVVIAGLNCCCCHSAFVRGWEVSPRWRLEAAGRGDGVRGVGVATRGLGLAALVVLVLALALSVVFFSMTDLLTPSGGVRSST